MIDVSMPMLTPPPGSVRLSDKYLPTDERQPGELDGVSMAYLLGNVDVSPLQARVRAMKPEEWSPDGQVGNVRVRRAFHDKIGVGSVVLITCDDMLTNVTVLPWWSEWRECIMPMFAALGLHEDQIIRCLLAAMPGNLHITNHHDTGLWAMKSHRAHIPVFTHDKVVFLAGITPDKMQRFAFLPGTCVELNNRSKHEVFNGGDETRVHLIFDFVDPGVHVPRAVLRPEQVVLQARRTCVVLADEAELQDLLRDSPYAPREGAPAATSELLADTDASTEAVLEALSRRDPSRNRARAWMAAQQQRGPEDRRQLLVDLQRVATALGGPAAWDECQAGFRRFAFGEMVPEDLLAILSRALGHAMERCFDAEGLPQLISDAERREALSRAYLDARYGPATHMGQSTDVSAEEVQLPPPAPEAVAAAVAAPRLAGALPLGARHHPACRKSMPAFIIIGVQKCGTTALYDYLCQHPLVAEARQKEPHFFDWKWDAVQALRLTSEQSRAAATWFPMASADEVLRRKYTLCFHVDQLLADRRRLTGEGTPSYLLGGEAIARRVKEVCPDAHLIVCLREPTARAYSHYQMVVDPEGTEAQKRRRGYVGGRSFLQVVAEDIKELTASGVAPGLASDDMFQRQYCETRPNGHGSHSFVGRGLYAKQLRLWLRHFSPQQISVVTLDEMKTPEGVNEVCQRLFATMGLPQHRVSDTSPKNTRKYDPIPADARDLLKRYYRDHNQELYGLVGRDLGWD